MRRCRWKSSLNPLNLISRLQTIRRFNTTRDERNKTPSFSRDYKTMRLERGPEERHGGTAGEAISEDFNAPRWLTR